MNLHLPICFLSCILCLSLLCGCIPKDPGPSSDSSQSTSAPIDSTLSYADLESRPPIVTLPEATCPEAPEIIQSPADAVNALFSVGNGYLSLVYGDKEYPAYDLNNLGYTYNSPAERFLSIISLYTWKASSDPEGLLSAPDPAVFILTSRDLTQYIKFCLQEDTGIIVYETTDEQFCWTADIISYKGDPARTITSLVRRDYDNMEFDFSRIRFECAGDAAAVTEYFLKTVLPEFLDSLEPESLFRIKNYSPYGYNLSEVSSEGDTIRGMARFYVIPQDPENTGWYGLNTIEGMGQHESWLMMELPFKLILQEDGYWQFIQEP
ncbi:MAG: hypothetical protein IJM50_03325 [Lachnospiraceae bacterium]|nr:hypothetical protein [Lachnospiraceae bacterium]